VGSVFSPYYAWARRRGGGTADPENHCALNVALYGPKARWAMTERGRRAVSRRAESFVVGPSRVDWDGRRFTVAFDEICAPVPRRLRGVVRATPGLALDRAFSIDARGRHEWRPISPLTEVEFEGEEPALKWRGRGYLDSNEGSEPLEAAFRSWSWGCAGTRDGAAILYDTETRSGERRSLALQVGRDGSMRPFAAPPVAHLAKGFWRMPRPTRCEPGLIPCVTQRLEDAPFYTRSRIATRLLGQDVAMMHESLSMDRFVHPVVQAMLPFRTPRRG
jgi:carotenoid 1,2-hydratase